MTLSEMTIEQLLQVCNSFSFLIGFIAGYCFWLHLYKSIVR